LKVYCDLVETESFTKTAQINEITQSAVSQQISTAERRFKCLLIERTKKRFRPTREGQVFYDYCKQILGIYESFLNKMQATKDILSTNMRVAADESIGLHELPIYLRNFLKACPTANVHTDYCSPSKVYEDVLEARADLGLVACRERGYDVEFVPLHQYEMVLICHPQHRLAKRKTVKIKELMGQQLVGFEPDMPMRKAIDRALRCRATPLRHVLEFDNMEIIKRAVEIEAGVAIVPRSTVVREVADQRLAAVKLEGANFNCRWGVIYKAREMLSPLMKQFIAVLKDEPETACFE